MFRSHRPSTAAAVLAAVVLLFLVSCGSDSPSGSTATTSPASPTAPVSMSPAACTDVAALKSSLVSLMNVKPLQDGLTYLNATIADVKTKLDTAVASVAAALRPAVEQVKTAFAAVQTAVSGVTTDNLREQAPAISAALQQLGTSTASLATMLTQTCPGR